jgi:hypothetical protein
VIILDGFQKLHLNSIANLETELGFLILHVKCACLEVEGYRFVPQLFTTYHVTWGTPVDCSVMIILAEYVL